MTIWDKLPAYIFETTLVLLGQFQNFKNHEGDLSQKLHKPNKPNQQTLCIETNTFNSGQLQTSEWAITN